MRRNSFEIAGSSEQFIVPLLNREIYTILDDLHFPSGAKVLDIGCGNQPLRKTIEERNWNYKSLDIAQNTLGNVDFIGRIDEDISINENFDLLICTEVLEHVLYWEKAFSNFRKLCKSDAKILLTCPFVYPLHEEPFDYWRPTVHALQAFATKNGFISVKKINAGTPWEVIGTLFNSTYITQPATNTWMQKIKIRLLLIALHYLRKELSSGKISSYANAVGTWYLSNIILLEKKEG